MVHSARPIDPVATSANNEATFAEEITLCSFPSRSQTEFGASAEQECVQRPSPSECHLQLRAGLENLCAVLLLLFFAKVAYRSASSRGQASCLYFETKANIVRNIITRD